MNKDDIKTMGDFLAFCHECYKKGVNVCYGEENMAVSFELDPEVWSDADNGKVVAVDENTIPLTLPVCIKEYEVPTGRPFVDASHIRYALCTDRPDKIKFSRAYFYDHRDIPAPPLDIMEFNLIPAGGVRIEDV